MSDQKPTTRAEFEARRHVMVTLEDGIQILCRRTTMRDLLQRGALSNTLVMAAQQVAARPNETGGDSAIAAALREGLENVAQAVAIDPLISLMPAPTISPAIWVGLLTLDDLGAIFSAVTGTTPPPAPTAEEASAPAAVAAPETQG